MADYQFPLPVPTVLTQPYWEAAKEHKLVVQRCRASDHMFTYAREHCPYCWSSDLEWFEVSGRGKVYTYTIIRQPADPVFNERVPYAYVIIQLDEGPRLPGNLINVDVDHVFVDMPVKVTFDDVTPEITLPKWEPDPDGMKRRRPMNTAAPKIHPSGVPSYTPPPYGS